MVYRALYDLALDYCITFHTTMPLHLGMIHTNLSVPQTDDASFWPWPQDFASFHIIVSFPSELGLDVNSLKKLSLMATT